jgi:hypothetical protein
MIVYSPEGATVTMQSPRTLRDNTRVVPGLTQAQYEDWLKGRGLVQNIMPHVSAEDREFLMTGYTPEDWAAIFPPEEDEG